MGTTDTDYTGDLADPRATAEDVDYLLEQANRWLDPPLTRDDLVGVYCGLRPLVAAELADGQTAALSREHVVLRPEPGLVMIAGGKYTTYRVMARDAVDAVVAERAAFLSGEDVADCTTDEIPSSVPKATANCGSPGRGWRGNGDCPKRRWSTCCGGMATAPIGWCRSSPRPHLAELLHPDALYLCAGGCRGDRRGARTVEDVLVRRTRLALETRDVGHAALPATVAIMADLLDWDPAEAAVQQERFVSDWPDSWQDEIAATQLA